MKKLLVVLLSVIFTLSASAQKVHVVPHYYHPRTRVIVGYGYGGFYPYYPFTPFDYYYGYPYARPSRLELKVQDIKSDYKDRIWSARHDSNLSRAERKTEVRRLKTERDDAIRDAERNYHNTY
jgi:hypothetical protein